MSHSFTTKDKCSKFPVNSRAKHEKSGRLNAGAKMFSDALRTIQVSRKEKSSRNHLCSLNEERLGNKAALDVPDNKEITSQVSSGTTNNPKTSNNSNNCGVQAENKLSYNDDSKDFTCLRSKSSVSSDEYFVFPPKSNDALPQTCCPQNPLPHKKIESQVSRLNELSSCNDKYPDSSEKYSNTTFDCHAPNQSNQNTHSLQLKFVLNDNNNYNEGNYSVLGKKENNYDKNNSIFKDYENNKEKYKLVLRKNSNDISMKYPLQSNPISSAFSDEDRKNANDVSISYRWSKSISDVPSDEDCISESCSLNDCETNTTFEECKTIPKAHAFSPNELCAGKSFNKKTMFFKPAIKSLSVNKSKYFTPKSILGKSYIFPVHYTEYISPSSTHDASDNKVTKNYPQLIYSEQSHNNVLRSTSLPSNHKFSAQEVSASDSRFNYKKDVTFEETLTGTVKNNSLFYNEKEISEDVNSVKSSLGSKLVNGSEMHRKPNTEASKGYHVPLSEIFGSTQKFDPRCFENAANGLNDIKTKGTDLFNQKEIPSVNECGTSLPVQFQANIHKNETLLKTSSSMKTFSPMQKYSHLESSVSPSFKNISTYQNKLTLDVAPSSINAVQQFKNGGVSNKFNQMTLGMHSSPANLEHQCLGNVDSMSKSSFFPVNSSSLDCCDKSFHTEYSSNIFDENNKEKTSAHQISVNNCASKYSEINCDKSLLDKQPVLLKNCDIYSYLPKYTTASSNYVKHGQSDGAIATKWVSMPVNDKPSNSSHLSSSVCSNYAMKEESGAILKKDYSNHSSSSKYTTLSSNCAIKGEPVEASDSKSMTVRDKDYSNQSSSAKHEYLLYNPAKDFSSHSSSSRYTTLSSNCAIKVEPVEALDSKCMTISDKDYSSQSSSAKHEFLPCNRTMEEESFSTMDLKQMVITVKKDSNLLSTHRYVSFPTSYVPRNEKSDDINQMTALAQEHSSNSFSPRYTRLSLNNALKEESVNALDKTQKVTQVENYYNPPGLHKNVPSPQKCTYTVRNEKSIGILDSKQMTIPVREYSSSSESSLYTNCGGESEHLSDALNDSISEDELQLCENVYRQHSNKYPKSISFREYMNEQNLVIKCNTDFIVPQKFSCDSRSNIPLSCSVLKVMPDVLIGTCLVDSSDESTPSDL